MEEARQHSAVNYRNILLNPIGWFALGIGLIIGFVLASGVEFSKDDGARFLGAMFGSLVAVGSAVSLYYLKQADDRRSRRVHVSKLARDGHTICENALKFLEQQKAAELQGQLFLLSKHIPRIARIVEKFEHEDDRISEIAIMFDENFVEAITELVDDNEILEQADDVKRIVELNGNCFLTVQSVMSGDHSFSPTKAE